MSDFKNSTHSKNWIFTKSELEKQHQRKFSKLQLCIARAKVQEKYNKAGPSSEGQRNSAMFSYYARRYLASVDTHSRGNEKDKQPLKEMLTPLLEKIYLNHYIARILRLWSEIPLRVKVK